ncbi:MULTISPECIES: response regulator [Cedecea]|jgi:two-component system response regulator AdeR|uniref:Chemotaxis protein CheY n=1 Tax=Cedecea neteri TaxID=158822 RepID=A0A089PUE5_9ENTR|nr:MULTISPECIES: response regulator [Cedecea]AIR03962.1 chemotaxis protein CheY [Cedecea neteri]NWC62202.1 response regulator transcription factor [Cedecea sp. P7760]
MKNKRVLVIEDDADAANVLEAYLTREGYSVSVAGDGLAGMNTVLTWKPDLILLDVMLPGMNGTEILAAVRRRGNTPVIMITAMGEPYDKIGALRYGADDYVVKPYNPGEVMARVQAVLRRSQVNQSPVEDVLRWGPLEVDVTNMVAQVKANGDGALRLDLTLTEFSILKTLMRASTRPLSRQYLLEECLPESDALERVVDTHVYNLRKKLEAAGVDNLILNVRGIGYRFCKP